MLRYIISIFCSIFSIVIIALLIGILKFDQIIVFLNISDPLASEMNQFYQKTAEALSNSFAIVIDIFKDIFMSDKEINKT